MRGVGDEIRQLQRIGDEIVELAFAVVGHVSTIETERQGTVGPRLRRVHRERRVGVVDDELVPFVTHASFGVVVVVVGHLPEHLALPRFALIGDSDQVRGGTFGVFDARGAEKGRDHAQMGHHLLRTTTGEIASPRHAHDQGDLESGFVQGALGAGHRDPVVCGEHHEGLLGDPGVLERLQHLADGRIHHAHRPLQLGDLGATGCGVLEVRRDRDPPLIVGLDVRTEEADDAGLVTIRLETMRLDEPDLQVERRVLTGVPSHRVGGTACDLGGVPTGVDVVESEPFRHLVIGQGARLVVDADQLGRVAGPAQVSRDVARRVGHVPPVRIMGESEDPGLLRVIPREQGRTRGRALRCGGERPLEDDAVRRERVQSGRLHRVDPVCGQKAAEVMAVQQKDVGLGHCGLRFPRGVHK